MKYLVLSSFFIALSVQAQNFSPSAGAVGNIGPGSTVIQTSPTGVANPPASPSAVGVESFTPNAPISAPPAGITGPTNLGQAPTPLPLGTGNATVIEDSNTAPTPIPDDTSLIQTPSNDPLMQSQEAIPGTGNGTTPSTGTPSTGTPSGTTQPSTAPTAAPFQPGVTP